VNIVVHTKGGLDARVYLGSNLSNDDIVNLIMIGTPNTGSPLANENNLCQPAIYDLRLAPPVTNVEPNNNIKYYTIAGNWIPSHSQLATPGYDLICSNTNILIY
jgi:hypothetical protein